MVKTRLLEANDGVAGMAAVEKLWTDGANPVHAATVQVFSRREVPPGAAQTRGGGCLRADLRLFRETSDVESSLRTNTLRPSPADTAHVDIHRYEEEIAGRTYHIEVHAVSREQWRAKLARRPGMPTAVMPFYGSTPELAARELTNWLSLVSASRPR